MIYMFLADGFEETEALVTLDLIRRAGIEIKTVGIGTDMPVGTHSIKVVADINEKDIDFSEMDGIILPGGLPGTENLFSSTTVAKAISVCVDNKLLMCAICAAPIVFGRKGLLDSKNAICYPGFENELGSAIVKNAPCVKDGNIITSKGAGCVFEFSHAIISYIKDELTANAVLNQIQHFGF